jgi:nicotinate-nucleotide adenylyltransferase
MNHLPAKRRAIRSDPPPELLPPQPVRTRLAVFGGSFNPVHNGHLALASHILRAGYADEVLFVPAGVPPHKPAQDLAPAKHRLAMLRAALAPFPEFTVSDIEAREQETPSYTIDTLQTLHLAFPEPEILFLMGMDCLAELATWYRAPELVSQFQFLIYPRPGCAPPKTADLAEPFGNRNAVKLTNSIIDAPLLLVAASAVREWLAASKNIAGLVPESVLAYIRNNQLYGSSNPKRNPHARNQDSL